jgi:hypothetical protein
MKRYWFIMALLLAGMGGYAHAVPANVDCQCLVGQSILSPTNPTETELQVLKQAATILGIAYSELLDMFQHGEATVEQDEDANWVVTAYVSGGNILIVVLESNF